MLGVLWQVHLMVKELYTGSFDSTYSQFQGGGNWILFWNSGNANTYKVTQSFALRSNKDLNAGVQKLIVNNWYR